MTRPGVLIPSLEAAVPLWMAQLHDLDESSRATVMRAWRDAAWEPLAHMSDVGMMAGGTKGEAASWFNHLARAIAVMSYAEGGVTCFGRHWCQDHARCCDDLVQNRVDVWDCGGDLHAAFARAEQREAAIRAVEPQGSYADEQPHQVGRPAATGCRGDAVITVKGSAKRPSGASSSGPRPGTIIGWRLAQPIIDLARQAEELGWPIIGIIGNTDHLKKHGDHTPWSKGKQLGVIYAIDVHPPADFETWLVAQCRSGYDTRWIDFFNINGRQYNSNGIRVTLSDDAHLHISVAKGYEDMPVTLFSDYAGKDETVDDKTIEAIANKVWAVSVTSPSLVDAKGNKIGHGTHEAVINSVTISRRLDGLEKALARIEKKLAETSAKT